MLLVDDSHFFMRGCGGEGYRQESVDHVQDSGIFLNGGDGKSVHC